MRIRSFLKSYLFRHSLSAGIAVFLAVLLNMVMNFSHESWMVLTAFLVSQTTRGTPLRQGIIVFMVNIIAIVAVTFLIMNVKNPIIIEVILSAIFIASAYVIFINHPLQNKNIFLILLFFIVIMIATLQLEKTGNLFRDRLSDVMMGTIIGILCGQFILPVRLDEEFRRGMIPILTSFKTYLHVITPFFLRQTSDKNQLIENRLQMEQALQTQQGLYPEWAYEVGFNPGLRAGFRFFMVNVERISEIFFSMSYLSTREMNEELLREIADEITHAMEENAELLKVLIEYFENNQFKKLESDFTSDIARLETKFHRIVPGNIELLEISQDYVTLTAFLRDIKDMRELLLQLVMALPEAQKSLSRR